MGIRSGNMILFKKLLIEYCKNKLYVVDLYIGLR